MKRALVFDPLFPYADFEDGPQSLPLPITLMTQLPVATEQPRMKNLEQIACSYITNYWVHKGVDASVFLDISLQLRASI